MTLNGSDAYLPANDDSPFISVFGGAQCGKSRSTKRAYAEPFEDDGDWYVNISPIVIRNMLTQGKFGEATLEHTTKVPSFEMMIEVYKPSKPLSELKQRPYNVVHPIGFVHTRNLFAFTR